MAPGFNKRLLFSDNAMVQVVVIVMTLKDPEENGSESYGTHSSVTSKLSVGIDRCDIAADLSIESKESSPKPCDEATSDETPCGES